MRFQKIILILLPAICSGLVWFNYFAYINSSTVFSMLFFSQYSQPLRIVSTIFIFSYIMQILGAFIIGRIGDSYGRLRAINIAGTQVALGTLLIGNIFIIESKIILSQILLLLSIAIQGFGLGGIKVGFDLIIGENYSNPENIVRVTSINIITTECFIMLTSVIGLLLSENLSWQHFLSFGWRAPFIVGGILLSIFLFIFHHITKNIINESQDLEHKNSGTLWQALCLCKEEALFLFSLDLTIYITYFLISSFVPHLLYSFDIIEFNKIYLLTLTTNTCFLLAILISAYIADKLRLRMTIFNIGMIILISCSVPLFKIVENTTSFMVVILVYIFIGSIVGIYFTPITAIAIEVIQNKWHRYKIMSFVFSFSGMAVSFVPVLTITLYNQFGQLSVIGWMISISNILCFIVSNILFRSIKKKQVFSK